MSEDGEHVIDATYSLLDRQIVDPTGRLAGKVDDIELTDPELDGAGEVGPPVVTAVLSGPGALGPRLGGRLGSFVVGTWRRLHPDVDPQPKRVPVELLAPVRPCRADRVV